MRASPIIAARQSFPLPGPRQAYLARRSSAIVLDSAVRPTDHAGPPAAQQQPKVELAHLHAIGGQGYKVKITVETGPAMLGGR